MKLNNICTKIAHKNKKTLKI